MEKKGLMYKWQIHLITIVQTPVWSVVTSLPRFALMTPAVNMPLVSTMLVVFCNQCQMTLAVDCDDNIRLPTPETEHLVKNQYISVNCLPVVSPQYVKQTTICLNIFSNYYQCHWYLVGHLELSMSSQIFEQIINRNKENYGLGGRWHMKKIRINKISWLCPIMYVFQSSRSRFCSPHQNSISLLKPFLNKELFLQNNSAHMIIL